MPTKQINALNEKYIDALHRIQGAMSDGVGQEERDKLTSDLSDVVADLMLFASYSAHSKLVQQREV